jgi:hypothetical protein
MIGSDVKINQDSIYGYEGLGFDMSTFNEDGSDGVYTVGISMPIHMIHIKTLFCGQHTVVAYSHLICQE